MCLVGLRPVLACTHREGTQSEQPVCSYALPGWDSISIVYQPLLTRRYLTSKLMPILAALAVALCTAMVLIVWSVMGGFLTLLLSSGKQMIGDVSVTWPLQGIAHYEQLIEDLEQQPEVEVATPTIEALGLLGLPGGQTRTIQVVGVEPDGYNEVTNFEERLWWRPVPAASSVPALSADPLVNATGKNIDPRTLIDDTYMQHAAQLSEPTARNDQSPAVVMGIEVSGFYLRGEDKLVYTRFLSLPGEAPRQYFMPNEEVTISVLPLTRKGGAVGTEDRRFPIANEFRSGLYEVDSNWVILPLATLQEMLKMDAAPKVDPNWIPGAIDPSTGLPEEPPIIGTEPARATNVLIKAAEGVSPDELEVVVRDVYKAFSDPRLDTPSSEQMRDYIYTWERKPGLAQFIAAVKKETALVLVLFSIISLVAVVLILTIFWSIISEKTKDIGVLRAVGASRLGIAWLFLRYGLLVGIAGSLFGGVLAHAVVWNINPIHDWMGRALGLIIWDPRFYYFSTIPNEVDPWKAALVMSLAVACAVVGAIVPAIRAAWLNPVSALRFE